MRSMNWMECPHCGEGLDADLIYDECPSCGEGMEWPLVGDLPEFDSYEEPEDEEC